MDVLERDQNALVGRNIHAGNTGHRLLSCRRSPDRPIFSYLGQVSTNANTTPFPLGFPGPGIVCNYPTWIRALLKDSTWFRQPSLCFSSLFRDLFGGFLALPGRPGLGTRWRLAGWVFCAPGDRFPGLF